MKSRVSSDPAEGNAALAADSTHSDLPAAFVAAQGSPGEEQASIQRSAPNVTTAAHPRSTLLALTPPAAAGSGRIPMVLGAVALVAVLAAGWAAYHQVEAVLARSHARGPAHLAYASETLRPGAAAPEKPPAAWQEKPNPAPVSILNREPISPAARANPAPAEAMSIPAFPPAAESALSASAASEANLVFELESARSVVLGERPPSNSAQLSFRRPAAEALVAEAPISGTDEISPSTEARSFASEPAAKAAEAAAERTMHSASSLRPEVPSETIARVPTDRPPSFIDAQTNTGEVTSFAARAVEPAAKFASLGIESPNLPPLVPVASTVVRAHRLPQTGAADVSAITFTDNLYMAIGATWPDEAAPSGAAELRARPGRRGSDTPPPQIDTQSERATINAGRSDAGQATISAAVVPSTSSDPAVPSGIDTPRYAAGTSASDPAWPTVEVSFLAAPEPPRVPPSGLSPIGAFAPPGFESETTPILSPPVSVDVARFSSPSMPTGAEALMLARGEAHLQSGDFAAARVFFQRAGRNHLAALGLAKTYDPLYFAESGVVGARGDRKLALKWYREAAEGAHHEARERLRKLEAAPK